MALNESRGDVEGAIEVIKSANNDGQGENSGNHKYNDYHHLLFEPEIWQKMDYIMFETSCSLSDAFKALIEFQEDEQVAARALKDRKKQL